MNQEMENLPDAFEENPSFSNKPGTNPGAKFNIEASETKPGDSDSAKHIIASQLAVGDSMENLNLYADLFNFAPVSHLSFDKVGVIAQANLCAAGILETDLSTLPGKNLETFLKTDSIPVFRKFLIKVYECVGKESCELTLELKHSPSFHVRMEGICLSKSSFCNAVLIDINDQKRAEDLLYRNEGQLETLFDLGVDAILLGDPEGSIIHANKRAFELSGYRSKELIGQNINILFSEEERKRVPWQYEMLKAGLIVRSERFLTRKDGVIVPVEMNSKMMPDRSYQTFIRDITERKHLEDVLKISEKKFSEAFRTSPDSININRASDGVYIDINEGFTNITGYSAEEVIGKSSTSEGVKLWVHDEDRDKMIKVLKERGEITGMEAQFRMKDGSVRYGLMSARFIEINGVTCVLSTTRDISNRKQQEENLQLSEKSYRGILNTVSESIYILNKDCKFIDINEGAVKMYGYSREEFYMQPVEFVSAPEMNDLEQVGEMVMNTFNNGITEHFEFWGLRKNGEVFPKDVICSKGIYFGEEVVIATARDITERKKNEETIIAARKKAEESERLKSAFLANMSHEIRSPMNSIVGFSELLDDEDLGPEQRHDFISIIRNSGKQLLTIINDIIDFAKIESNQLSINPTQLNLNKLLESIQMTTEVEKKNLGKHQVEMLLEKGFADDNCSILCDEVRLKQVLLNLVGNALKFTNAGYIKTGYYSDEDKIIFYVKDTGKGIAKDKQHIIFERFRQEEESYTRLYGGTGLGLSISKGIVELMGGKIWLESETGSGATFYFSLPIKIWEGYSSNMETPKPTTLDFDFSNRKLLVAEDIYANFRLINYMLSRTNAEVLYAEDGTQAVKLCMENPDIDLVLMDIQMPVMDGYEATAGIRKFMPDLPVIALTAYSSQEDLKKFDEAGFNDFLTKPVDKKTMFGLILKYIKD
ncbi:MAG: PAS domain S-box protein [Bacteroidales bacterium]|nr:PAS domain S-box protein [Bacteroidales bacterium]